MPSDQSLDLISKLIAFDTTSRNSNLELISFVEDYLDGHGVTSRRVPDATGEKANLVATIGPAEQPGYILSGHTDTVPVDGQDWTNDPFEVDVRGDKLYGRGAADMKSFCAIVLSKVPEMVSTPLARPLHLAFSYDEEVGCLGVRDLVREMSDWTVRPEACFVGEPTEMQVVIGHKGKKAKSVEITGKTTHSSLAPQAVNAVEYAARLIVKIYEIGQRLRTETDHDLLYDVPFSTAHVAPIQGGTSLNIVPDECRFDFEFRVIAADDRAALMEEVEAYARDVLVPEMKARAPEAGIAFTDKSDTPGLDTMPEAPVTALAKSLAEVNSESKVAFGTEGGLFSEWAEIPTIVCGPGSIEQAHKADEFIALTQIDKCERFLDRLIAHSSQAA